MLKLLFWNLNRRDLRHLVCNAANAVSPDVVILIESSVTMSATLADLKARVSPAFDCPRSALRRFQLFSRNPDLDLSEAYGGDRVTFRRLKYARTELILGVVHVVDRMNWDQGNQLAQIQLLAAEVRRQEDGLGHARTVLIGDFNMNPFDQAMNMAPGLNAMMAAKCVERGGRTLQQQEYRFFYNPMWGLFGDRTPGPAGTYYHRVPSRGVFGWNMLDQVLLRPAAIPWFGDVEILTSAGGTSLHTKSGRPDRRTSSDHFPILVILK